MIKNILLALLISSQAFAGLPPPTVKSQSDSTAKTKFQIQAPHNQFTDLGGVKTLIETGNGNILPDPGFEALTSGWTASGGATATANSTAKGTGAKGYDWDSNSAGQTLQSTSVTIPDGLAGKNGIASCNIKTISGTATHTFTVNNGTTDIVTPITIQSSTASFLGQNEGNKINFVFPTSGTIRIKLAAVNANEPEIYVDDCSIQLANNVYDAPLVTQWVSFTGVYSAGFGTVTNNSCFKRRVGGNLEVKCAGTTGTVAASTGSIDIPDSLVIDTTKNPVVSSLGNSVGIFYQDGGANRNGTMSTLPLTSTTKVYVGPRSNDTALLSPQTMSSMYGSSSTFSLNFSVPISGWSAVSAVSADQTDYGDTTYTLTSSNTQGIGTPTGECQHSRVSDKLKIRCKVTNGTTTASEMRINLPNSLTSADTTRIPSIQLAGYATFASANTNQFQVYIEPSVQYLTFGFQGSASGLTKQTGSAEFGTGAVYSFSAEVPIQGWSSNQRAPTIVNSVTINSGDQKRAEIISFCYGGSATCSGNCTGGTCNTSSVSSSLTSVTYNSTGNYTMNFNKTYSKLFCSGNVAGSGVSNAILDPTFCTNCSSRTFNTANYLNVNLNTFGTLTCVGEL